MQMLQASLASSPGTSTLELQSSLRFSRSLKLFEVVFRLLECVETCYVNAEGKQKVVQQPCCQSSEWQATRISGCGLQPQALEFH